MGKKAHPCGVSFEFVANPNRQKIAIVCLTQFGSVIPGPERSEGARKP